METSELITDLQEQIKSLQMENACLSIRKTPSILPSVKTIAKLCYTQTKRDLSIDEIKEMKDCLKAYKIYADKLMDLQTLSFAAYIVGDIGYQHEICAWIEKLEEQGQAL